MQVAILTDTHAGSRGDLKPILDHQEVFYLKEFFPELDRRNIKHILHLGDMFDRRKNINYGTLNRFRLHFLEQTVKRGIRVTLVAGNHDTFNHKTNEINALDELLGLYPNFKIISKKPEIVEFGSSKIALVPWISEDNQLECLDFIARSHGKVDRLAGHFEIAGFEMSKGQLAEHGLDASLFWKYPEVWSGHYHTASQRKNIIYFGTSMEFTWSDFGDEKAYHIYDTEAKTLERLKNPHRMFYTVTYDDSLGLPALTQESLSDRFVKLLVKEKHDKIYYDKFVEAIRNQNPFEFSIMDAVELNQNEVVVAQVQGMQEIFKAHVAATSLSDDRKERVAKTLHDLYMESNYES